ncbi:unnamed protein product [Rotaria sp. Silwood1]|nr:unnamed protein product [Rotaria sp. Silwood1]CAF4747307.1 unnamed protein product [Rotaria sp. Silwood1]
MLSTFDTLPDEIIMIILKYCGDTFTILKIFLDLNQRLNMILIDKHKKELKLLEKKKLKLSPSLIHQLDKDGNNSLLYMSQGLWLSTSNY